MAYHLFYRYEKSVLIYANLNVPFEDIVLKFLHLNDKKSIKLFLMKVCKI